MKKAGLKPCGSFRKYFYDNVSGSWDSRTNPRHRSCSYAKKGGKRQVEITQTRGTLVLEFYAENGPVLRRWQTGDPLMFTVELPPRTRVYHRTRMEHFSGSICFR